MKVKNFFAIFISINLFWAGINFFILSGFDARNFDFSAWLTNSARAQSPTTYSENWQVIEGVYPTGFLSATAYSTYFSNADKSRPRYDVRDGISAYDIGGFNFPRYVRSSSPSVGGATVSSYYAMNNSSSSGGSSAYAGNAYSSNRFFQPIKWRVSGAINSLPYTENWYVSESKYSTPSYSQSWNYYQYGSCGNGTWTCNTDAGFKGSSSTQTVSGGTFSSPAAPASDVLCGATVDFLYDQDYNGNKNASTNNVTINNQGGSMCFFVPTKWTADISLPGGAEARETWILTAGAGNFGGCDPGSYTVSGGGSSIVSITGYDPDCDYVPTQWSVTGAILP